MRLSTALDSPSGGVQDSTALSQLYRLMNGLENSLGGGEGVVGLYGSIAPAHTERLFQSLSKLAGMSSESILMDVGSGLCRPLIHALATGRVAACRGVEVDRVKCQKAEAFIELTKKRMRAKGMTLSSDFNVEVVNESIEQVKSLDPVTHVYSFWEGVPVDARAGLGRLFRESTTVQAICVVQRAMRCASPADFMCQEYGFGALRLLATSKVTMSGSGRSFTAYVFSKETGVGGKRKHNDTSVIQETFKAKRRTGKKL
jgi:hypothetical protein